MIGRADGRIAAYCGTKSKGMGPKCEVMEYGLEGFNWRKRKGEGRIWLRRKSGMSKFPYWAKGLRGDPGP